MVDGCVTRITGRQCLDDQIEFGRLFDRDLGGSTRKANSRVTLFARFATTLL
jgi:hypothetical protein